MIVGIGVDRIAVARFQRLLAKGHERSLERFLLARELLFCLIHPHPAQVIAARWAAKEAVSKCFGTGFTTAVRPLDMEIDRHDGAPVVRLYRTTAATASRLGITRIHLSMSHDEAAAIAFAVAESEP